MSNVISLPEQPVFAIPRSFIDKVVPGTLINGEVYFSSEQCAMLMGITLDNWYQRMARRASSGGSGTYHEDRYQTVYEIPVAYPSVDGQRYGGLKPTHFHHHKKLLAEAMTIRDKQKREPLVFWLVDVGSQVIQNGFAVDPHALQHDPAVAPAIITRVGVYNWSQERHQMADHNKTLSDLFFRCSDCKNPDGSYNEAHHIYFSRCAHNTAHISAVGMNALQLRATRCNPTQLDFGQYNYMGKNAPRDSELGNSCNFLTDNELIVRIAVIHQSVGRISVYMDTYGSIPVSIALRMFTMHSGSIYLRNTSWDYNDYPETAITNLTLADKQKLSADHIAAVIDYQKNYPYRHNTKSEEAKKFRQAEYFLTNESLIYAGAGQPV